MTKVMWLASLNFLFAYDFLNLEAFLPLHSTNIIPDLPRYVTHNVAHLKSSLLKYSIHTRKETLILV